jgi:hypothetical protein
LSDFDPSAAAFRDRQISQAKANLHPKLAAVAPVSEGVDPQLLASLAAYQPDAQSDVDPLIQSTSPGMAAVLAQLPPPHSIVTEGTDTGEGFNADADGAIETELLPNDANVTEDAEPVYGGSQLAAQFGLDLNDPDTRYALAELYGDQCPLLLVDATEEQWCEWGPALWSRHEPGMQPILHRAEKLRNFRDGNQWISSRGYGMWYVPPKPSGMVRVVDNMMAPAMDYRVEIVAEQRPGFKTKPENQDQRTLKRAEAQQAGVEYQFDQQKMPRIQREAEYWAQSDGVAFLESFWDPDRGPWDQFAVQQGEQVQQMRGPLGDNNTVVHRIDEVRVSANATATIRPNYMVIKKTRALSNAIADYGKEVATATLSHAVSDVRPMQQNRLLNPIVPPDQLLENQAKVDEYTIYLEKSALLPQGLWTKCIGGKCVIPPQPLLYGRIPVSRWTDGSTDPSYFPKPVAYEWCDTQQRINACESKLVESIRLNAGEKLLAKRDALSSETLQAGNMTIFEYKGGGSLRDAVQALPSSSVGDDVKVGLEMWVKRFEQLTGYNDQARGSADPGDSGRAILANREALEKLFGPCVKGAAEAMAEWAEIQCAIMGFGYDQPRMVAVLGAGRPDLVREISAQDFDGVAQVTVDAETLMPLPRALRLYLLEDMYQKGLISAQEYRRRLPFGFVGNIESPDTDHYARAKRSIEAIKQTGMPNPPQCPILWMDNCAIHQEVLERELILPDDGDPMLRYAAYERWTMYGMMALAQGAAALQGGPSPHGPPMPGMGAPAGQQQPTNGGKPGGMRKSVSLMPAGVQPFASSSPGIAASSAKVMAGGTPEQSAGRTADLLSRQ